MPALARRFTLSCALLLCALLSACSEPLEFADWTIPVPEDTRIIEYTAVPMEERTERIELIEDLVIGQRGDPDYMFFQARGVVADSKGRIFVLDAGDKKVKAYDAAGTYLFSFGREGQGPGEFSRPNGLVITGEQLIVQDSRNNRFSSWSFDGEHLGDYQLGVLQTLLQWAGLDDGRLVGTRPVRPEGLDDTGPLRYMLGVYGVTGETYAELQELPPPAPPGVQRGGRYASVSLPYPYPTFAATPSGQIYSTLGAEYEIYSFELGGQMLWAMRTAWPRRVISEEEIENELERIRGRIPDLKRSEIEWPELYPALSHSLRIDGHGHLYVAPTAPRAIDERPGTLVDVYSQDGKRLFAGWGPSYWVFARGDHVFTIRTDRETDEQRVVRYRLVEPF